MTGSARTRPLTAAGFMICAMAIIGVIDNYVALVSDMVGLWQFHLVRAALALPLVAAAAALWRHSLRVRRPGWVALRSLAIGLAMLCYFGALGIMPIAQALAGLFTSPVFVLVMTALFARERIGPARVLAVACGFGGALVVLRPGASDFGPELFLPVLGGAFYAVSVMITRHRCAAESPLALLAAMFATLGLLGAVGLLLVAGSGDGFLTRGWDWPISGAMPIIAMQAAGSALGVLLIIRAYQLGEPSRIAVFEYSVMLFGPLYGLLALGQPVGGIQWLGIGLVAASGAIVAARMR